MKERPEQLGLDLDGTSAGPPGTPASEDAADRQPAAEPARAAQPEPAGAAQPEPAGAAQPEPAGAPQPEPAGAALPDAEARRRIAGELETSLLVEAGAGSGKTTALVRRMVALVQGGSAEVTEIAAVTFTRKAAGELRERFQEALEEARAQEGTPTEARARLERALQDLDRAFMGTIHAFCARLLRERPIEAGIDPGFIETTAPEADRLASRYWGLHLERLAATGDSVLGELEDVGLTPADLRHLYDRLRENLDVEYPLEPTPPPDPAAVAAVRMEVDGLLDEAARLMPSEEPPEGWEDPQRRLRSVLYVRAFRPWGDDRVFLDALAELCSRASWKVTQKRWADEAAGKLAAKRLGERMNRLLEGGARLLDEWWAHRYPIAMRFALEAAHELERYRRETGQLDFQDLLVLAARLLRGSAAREALGRRWKRILVDEFQDTDPLQAEVLFLLASDAAGDGGDWTRAVPRPGALFVVGDPKQSIYRFRRADIALYTQIRGRFASFGDVLELVTNFRSGQPVASLVNSVFSPPEGFPEEGHAAQAAFAPLVPVPRPEPAPAEGVFHYSVQPDGRGRGAVALWSASALADWIATRVGPGGDRRPGDFLILTRKKDALECYARALEARNLPVRVSGAGVGVEDEIAELALLIEALIDPEDASRTVAVLLGPFFGVDHEQLLGHRESGLGFDFRHARAALRPPDPAGAKAPEADSPEADSARVDAAPADSALAGDFEAGPVEAGPVEAGPVEAGPVEAGPVEAGPVEAALGRLRSWWVLARDEPADVVLGRIASEVGLLPWAAAGELGGVRAGALAFVMDAVRATGLAGDTSLAGALAALGAATQDDEAEAPLEPGRSDTIRLMNLHKAKGLEASVVVLAAPYGEWDPAVDRHIERGTGGRARGWLAVARREGRSHRTLARPALWSEKEAAERVFGQAEDLRLLYVAATRAAEELVIARSAGQPGKSPWARFDPWLDANAVRLDLAPVHPPERERLEVGASELMQAAEALAAARAEAAAPTFTFESVTRAAKAGPQPPVETAPPPILEPGSGPGGYEWGSAVHAVLEAAARGAPRDRLRALGRALLLELDRPVAGGEPTELEALLATAAGVLDSDLWRRAQGAERTLAEVPFALGRAGYDGAPRYLEGVIDLVFRESDGWVLVDYKTDRGDDPDFPARREAYREQLRVYGEAWQELVGEPVKERALWFVRLGVVESVSPPHHGRP